MRLTESQNGHQDLTGSQAAQLLREGRLGHILIRRASAQAERHNALVGDQADALRRAVRAHDSGTSRADGTKADSTFDGAAA